VLSGDGLPASAINEMSFFGAARFTIVDCPDLDGTTPVLDNLAFQLTY